MDGAQINLLDCFFQPWTRTTTALRTALAGLADAEAKKGGLSTLCLVIERNPVGDG